MRLLSTRRTDALAQHAQSKFPSSPLRCDRRTSVHPRLPHRGRIPRRLQPLRHPVSSLALGPSGWTQIANFITTGLLMLLFAIGLRRHLHAAGRPSTWGPLLVGTYAIGLIGAGVFVTDPVGGYPLGTPAQAVHTWHGMLHDSPFSLSVFASLAAACFVFAWRFTGWRERG
ncbi:DUF998 domain-containing protein [Nonomuraea fuscirosea]|uniref:DUF998 domain-containing protein n=1 Tax=Nonomuraea fuscirosea TaxID=1291556 RepID=UPI00341A759C